MAERKSCPRSKSTFDTNSKGEPSTISCLTSSSVIEKEVEEKSGEKGKDIQESICQSGEQKELQFSLDNGQQKILEEKRPDEKITKGELLAKKFKKYFSDI